MNLQKPRPKMLSGTSPYGEVIDAVNYLTSEVSNICANTPPGQNPANYAMCRAGMRDAPRQALAHSLNAFDTHLCNMPQAIQDGLNNGSLSLFYEPIWSRIPLAAGANHFFMNNEGVRGDNGWLSNVANAALDYHFVSNQILVQTGTSATAAPDGGWNRANLPQDIVWGAPGTVLSPAVVNGTFSIQIGKNIVTDNLPGLLFASTSNTEATMPGLFNLDTPLYFPEDEKFRVTLNAGRPAENTFVQLFFFGIRIVDAGKGV